MVEGTDKHATKEKEARKPTWKKGPRERTLWSKLWDRTGFRGKTLWDVLQLLVVPLVLLALGYSLTSAQQSAQQLKAAQVQRELEVQRAQDAALQAYLDVMKGLLLDEDLRHSGPNSSVRAVATTQTLLILDRVDGPRKGAVLRLLADSRLIDADAVLIDLAGAELSGADLSEADLSATDLSEADLSGAYLDYANLSEADLSGANLSEADLNRADLSGANLSEADLSVANLLKTDLRGANLSGAFLYQASLHDAYLSGADLSGADLWEAYLNGAHLSGANLTNADLSGAQGATGKQLEDMAKTLEGATMPDGSKHP